jgi:hypothetical protein
MQRRFCRMLQPRHRLAGLDAAIAVGVAHALHLSVITTNSAGATNIQMR